MSKFGVPTDDQLAKINKLAKRTLSKDEVFVFPSKLAGDMIIPNRYIQLQKELLDVYATDAKKGVSLLLDHSWSPDGFFGLGGRPKAAIPYGRTFDSRYEASTEEGETISLVADHYMVKGVEIDGIKTNDLASSIEAGTLFDTSIGFGFDKATCSVCGENYRSNKCSHYAGKTYEIEENGVTKNKLCFIKAEPPGYLMENSLVFDGAYPGAGVLSNVGEIGENENGVFEVISDIKNIDPAKRILSIYSNRSGLTTLVKKSDYKKVFTGGFVKDNKSIKLSEGLVIPTETASKINEIIKSLSIPVKGVEKSMNENALKMLESLGVTYSEGDSFEELFGKIAEKWDSTNADTSENSSPTLSVGDLVFPVGYLEKTFGKTLSSDEFEKLAKEGQAYRESLIKEALSMGVRAMANDFDSETWKATFDAMSTEQIQKIMKNFEKQAMENIPDGRKTNPGAGQGQDHSAVPDEAYKVGR